VRLEEEELLEQQVSASGVRMTQCDWGQSRAAREFRFRDFPLSVHPKNDTTSDNDNPPER